MKRNIESLRNQAGIIRRYDGAQICQSVSLKVIMFYFVQMIKLRFSPGISVLLFSCFLMNGLDGFAQPAKVFRAGAATSNITPKIGTSINGNMKDGTVKQIHDETHARCIVLDDGQTRLAILTADLCMIYREQLDEAKERAYAITRIPIANMMMSATHTHSG